MSEARVHSIQTSPGGVPKLRVEAAEVTTDGLVGDGHNSQSHGGADRAVLLLGLDAIAALRAEGHAIAPGSTGENVTIEGLRWADVGPGDRLSFEGGVVVEMVQIAAPCHKIKASFSDEDFMRLDGTTPGHGRWCARVITPGPLRVGESVAHVRAKTGSS